MKFIKVTFYCILKKNMVKNNDIYNLNDVISLIKFINLIFIFLKIKY